MSGQPSSSRPAGMPRYVDRGSLIIAKGQAAMAAFVASRMTSRTPTSPKPPSAATSSAPSAATSSAPSAYPQHWTKAAQQPAVNSDAQSGAGIDYPAHWAH